MTAPTAVEPPPVIHRADTRDDAIRAGLICACGGDRTSDPVLIAGARTRLGSCGCFRRQARTSAAR